MALALSLDAFAVSSFQAPHAIKQEPQDHVYPAFESEYDDLDLDAALFEANAGMEWDGSAFGTCFFDDAFGHDGHVPSLSELSSEDMGLPESASCSSLDSNCSSVTGMEESAAEVPTLRLVPTAARSTRRGAGGPAAAAPRCPSVPAVGPARPWAPPAEVPPLTMTREERVQRYREKRKRRTFEKTIRYEARRAYAEVRPRIKGRFATKEEAAAMKAARLAGVPYEC